MPEELAEKEIKRLEQLKKKRGSWLNTWQAIADISYPRKANIVSLTTEGECNNQEILDGTILDSANLLSSTMSSTLTGAEIDWLSPGISYHPDLFEKDKDGKMVVLQEIRQWFDDIETIAYNYINDSNFHPEVFEFNQDSTIFGTACIFADEIDDEEGYRIYFRAYHPKELIISEDIEGRIRTVYREFKMSAENIKVHWPDIMNNVEFKQRYDVNPFEEIPVAHVVRKDTDNLCDDKSNKFVSIYILDIGKNDRFIINKTKGGKCEGYPEWPYAVVRWLKRSGEFYGESPAYQAKPDGESLQETIRMKFLAIQKAIAPPILTEEEFDVDMSSLAVNRVQDVNSTKALHENARFDVVEMEIDRLQKSIENKFHVDSLRLPPFEGTPMTATEAQMRWAIMHRILGPVLTRYVHEFHTPIIARVLGMLERKNLLPPRPLILEGQVLRWKYNGPLADAQKLDRVIADRNLMVDIANMQGIPKVGQEAALSVNGRNYVKNIAESTGVSENIVEWNDDNYDASIQALQESEAEAREAETAKTQSEAIKNAQGSTG